MRKPPQTLLLRELFRNFLPCLLSDWATFGIPTIQTGMLTSALALGFSPTTPACRPVPSQQMAANARAGELGMNLGRRAFLGGAAASALLTATPALAKIDSVNPANNYYFPMARTPVKRPGWRLVALPTPMIQRGPAHWQRVLVGAVPWWRFGRTLIWPLIVWTGEVSISAAHLPFVDRRRPAGS